MMDILRSETCWAHKKWNNIASDIKLVFHSSTIPNYFQFQSISRFGEYTKNYKRKVKSEGHQLKLSFMLYYYFITLRVMFCYVIFGYIIKLHYVLLLYFLSCYITLYVFCYLLCFMLCFVMSFLVMLLNCIMFCYIIIFFKLLYYIICLLLFIMFYFIFCTILRLLLLYYAMFYYMIRVI